MIGELLAILLLATFLLIKIALTLMRTFGRITGRTWRKVLRLEVPENEKKGLERVYTLAWVLVGAWAFLKLWGWSPTRITAAFFGFLAFRGGANVAKTLIYGLHDQRIIEGYTEDSKVLGVVGKATKLSLLLETLFVVAFALAYKALSVALKPGGMGANTFILSLWLSGLVFGSFFAWFIARNNRGILLKDAIATVGFFTLRKGKKKAEGTLKKPGEVSKKLGRGFSKPRK
ncbi:hypothetical protein [Thermococcus celer]|uniref:Uncharacterized protein n=1 Tax=Thermococcus celer Vu 13 = JCM 8558 TaxID=1293037 RepID=A0A218P3J4_THECE|nr:hypothetical protein [Thermococcus celer]ASI99495.1 hypothetical protein A3L02_07950 [Thermococcus celer Vu 13 = JCM 8558]